MASILKPFLLKNGRHMPRIGLGTFQLTGDKCSEVVQNAIKTGYRMIDTAYSYGNEALIGDVVQQTEKEGHIKRDDLFLVTKVPQARLAPEAVKQTVEESLENLKTNFIDLLLIHSPWALKDHGDGNLRPMADNGLYDYEKLHLLDTWKAFEDVVNEGKVTSIGVSNFTEKQLRVILGGCNIKPQVIQFECHAYYQQRALSQFCLKHGIHCMAYSALGAPSVPERHLTDENRNIRLLEDPVVKSVSEKIGKTPAQVLLRFLLQRNFAVIPKASSLPRLEENFDVADFKLSTEDVNTLKGLDRGLRFFTFPLFSKHPDFPKPDEFY